MTENALFGTRRKAARDYWRQRLAELPRGSTLPLARARPTVYSPKKETLLLEVDGDLHRRLAKLSAGSPFLLYAALLAVLQTCLARYRGGSAVVVGSPAPREGPDGAPNAVAIVDRVDPEGSFRQRLLAVRGGLQEAYSHLSHPHDAVIRDLGLEPVEHRCPLFDVSLALDGFHGPLPELKTDVEITVSDRGDRLVGEVRYNPRLFSRATVERFIGHFRRLLDGALGDLAAPVHRLPMLSRDEERHLLSWCVAPAGPEEPEGGSVLELVREQAARNPDRLAVTLGERGLSYGELARRSSRLAHDLRGRGIGPGARVAVAIDRSLEMVVAVLGVLEAGAAYVPVDPTFPAERIAYLLEDSETSLLLTVEAWAGLLPGRHVPVLRLDAADGRREPSGSEAPAAPVRPATADLAYVIYTSGSTGKPKGVAMTHGCLANLIRWQIRGWDEDDPAWILQFATLSFDVSFQEIFSTWASGGTLVLIPADLRRDPAALSELLERRRIRRIFLPFVALQQLATALETRSALPAALREVITAGERLQVSPPVVSLFRNLPGCRLVNQYGPSESHVVTAFTLEGAPTRWPALPPIGGPIPNAEVYLLGPHLELVPEGAPGEICLGGAATGRGYLGRPALTAERFVPAPLSGAPGGRLYRTGDLGRHLSTGDVEFLGRMDHQVKIRGVRVEPGEVEAVVAEHPAVREAVVVAREEAAGDRRLVAYVVPRPGAEPTTDELRSFVAGKLPESMVPATAVLLDALPLTPTGKVDRRALPAPDQARPELGAGFVAPRYPAEERLAAIWSAVLATDRVGVEDSFFDLGGHSLLAAQVVARIREEFGVEVPLPRLFELKTIALVAAEVLHLRAEQAGIEVNDELFTELEELAPSGGPAPQARGAAEGRGSL